MEAKVVYNSIEPVERAGPETNMADSAVESKTLLPAEKLHNVQQVFEALNERAQGRLALLEETLRATAFSEWADIFSIWLAEKNNALSRYTKPSSVDMAEVRSGRGGGGGGGGEGRRGGGGGEERGREGRGGWRSGRGGRGEGRRGEGLEDVVRT